MNAGSHTIGFALTSALVAPVAGQQLSFPIQIDPGGTERWHEPVELELRVGADIASEKALPADARWRGAIRRGVQSIPAQVESWLGEDGAVAGLRVAWIEPSLAGEALRATIVVEPATDPVAGGFAFRDGDGFRELVLGADVLWRHEIAFDPDDFATTFKTYHHVMGFHGEGPITKGAGGLHPHHRGLFLGWSKTRVGDETHNFWWAPGDSRPSQRHAGFDAEREVAGPVFADSVSTTRWVASDGEAVVEDVRAVRTWRQPEGRMLVDVDLEIRSLGGTVELDGDSAHAGFQFRAAQSVADAKSCTYELPQGATGGENDNWSRCPYAVARFPIGDHRYEVQLMSARGNPAPVFNTRDYGRFGAFFRATVPEDEPLRLSYRLVVRDAAGKWGDDALDAYAAFLVPVRARVVR